jgi:hypothetical protein
MPGQQRSLGSERGLATPSPDGKGEIALGPSMKIMPVDSYSTLGRSCEPAFKWILLGAGLRDGVRRSLSAGPRRAAMRRAARSPGREAHPRSGRPYPGPDPLTGGRGRGIPARSEANSGIHRCLPAVTRSALPDEADLTAAVPAARATNSGSRIVRPSPESGPAPATCLPGCAWRAISLPGQHPRCGTPPPGPTPHSIDRVLPHSPWAVPDGRPHGETAEGHSERCCGIPASSARTSVSR